MVMFEYFVFRVDKKLSECKISVIEENYQFSTEMQMNHKACQECSDITCMSMQNHRHGNFVKELTENFHLQTSTIENTECVVRLKQIIPPILQIIPHCYPRPSYHLSTCKVYSRTILIPRSWAWITILVIMIECLWQISDLVYPLEQCYIH